MTSRNRCVINCVLILAAATDIEFLTGPKHGRRPVGVRVIGYWTVNSKSRSGLERPVPPAALVVVASGLFNSRIAALLNVSVHVV